MRKSSLLLICTCAVLALSSAKPWNSNSYNQQVHSQREGYFDLEGRYHSKATAHFFPVASTQLQQESGVSVCQSAIMEESGGISSSYVHFCSAGKDPNGKWYYDRV